MALPLRGRRLRSSSDELAAAGGMAIPCFVAGAENRLVAATVNRLLEGAKASAPREDAIGSPLLFLGSSGCGKTHLAHGVAEAWHVQRGDELVAYLTASDFRRQVASAIADRSIAELRKQLRRCKLLVIDDLPRLAGEAYALEELIHTIDALQQSGGLVLATSAKPLAETPKLSRALISRMASGVTLSIAPLGEHARRELLRVALDALGCGATPEGLELLSREAPNNPPRLFASALLMRRRLRAGAVIDRPMAAELLKTGAAKNSPPATDIVVRVAKYYGLPKTKLVSSSRQQTTVLARAVAIYLMRELTPLSYDQIGKLLGGRDHTTVMHNYRRIDRALANDRALREAIDELRGSIAATNA